MAPTTTRTLCLEVMISPSPVKRKPRLYSCAGLSNGRQRSEKVGKPSSIRKLKVMLRAMRDLWDQGSAEAKREAARIAKDAAPYVHPRLSSIDQTVSERPRYVARVPEPCLHYRGMGSPS